MKTPASPRAGAAGEKIERKRTLNRSFNTPRPPRQTRTIDVEPNWRRLGTIIDDMVAGLTPEST